MIKILLVKESASESVSLKRELTKFNYDVEIVNNADAIYPAFYNYNPDIVIMDSRINGVDGWAVSRELNEFSRHHSCILILNNSYESQVGVYDTVKVDILEGSFSTHALVLKINEILQRESFINVTTSKFIQMTG